MSSSAASLPWVVGDAQRLLDGALDAVEELVDAQLQAFVLVHQRIADKHARHAAVLLGKAEQQREDAFHLLQTILLFGGNLVDQPEHGLFDEFDQAFEHLRLAGEVAIQCCFGQVQPCGQRGRGDLFALGLFQHFGDGLQDL